MTSYPIAEFGEAAFYGPKVDIQMRDMNGKENTAFTVQYDFVMPARFNLTYIDSDGKEKQPIVIHRSSIGAIERIIAFLIEHYAGVFLDVPADPTKASLWPPQHAVVGSAPFRARADRAPPDLIVHCVSRT